MSSNVLVLDYQIISSIGLDVNANLQALKENRSGIDHQTLKVSKHAKPFGAIKHTNEALNALIKERFPNKTINLGHIPRATLLHILALHNLEQWFEYSNVSKVGLISANTVGGIDQTSAMLKQATTDIKIPFHEAGAITQQTLAFFNQKMWHTTISTACSSSANSIMMGAKMIAQKKLDVVIVGGVDALTQYTINGFLSLKILDEHHCQPFSSERAGLNLGEGAAFLVLASEEWAKKNNLKGKAILSGFGNANDAYHQTASSPEGVGNFLAMQSALERAKLKPEQIQYVNAHGTGTDNNDTSENHALSQLFKNASLKPLMSSTKTYTGHTLGAAGAIEAVFSLLAIQEQIAWGQGPTKSLMDDLSLKIVEQSKKHDIQHILSNSFGFGGNCSSLIFSKI